MLIRLTVAFLCILLADTAVPQTLDLDRAEASVRVATFNASLSRRGAGVLVADIAKRKEQVLNVADILLRVRPDIVLINELDHDPEHRAVTAFRDLLAEGVRDLPGLDYAHVFHGPSNTGVPSGHDLDGDGRRAGPEDAFGYGEYPGHYAMALLSRFPLGSARTWARFPWFAMPDARRPMNPDGTPYHDEAAWADLRLSSKSHWLVPVSLPDGSMLHMIAAHPTPPVFDGPEDRNGRRNADEIRLLRAILDDAAWLMDDDGAPGGLAAGASFVVLGDLNTDPEDGDSDHSEIRTLLGDPRLRDPAPVSPGGLAAAEQGGPNAAHKSRPGTDTADFREDVGPGNLRVDYVLPSADLQVTGSGVFWPDPADPLARLVGMGREMASSDHRLVWVDLVIPPDR